MMKFYQMLFGLRLPDVFSVTSNAGIFLDVPYVVAVPVTLKLAQQPECNTSFLAMGNWAGITRMEYRTIALQFTHFILAD